MVLEAQNISVSFQEKTPLFSSVNLRLESKKRILLSGPSGSGKSSLLRVLNGLQAPQSGKILLDGQNIENQNMSLVRKRVGLVLQKSILLQDSIFNNLCYGRKLHQMECHSSEFKDTLHILLKELALEKIDLKNPANTLSGGEAQRCAFLRSYLVNPDFLLLDEPASALDHDSVQILEEFLLHSDQCKNKGILVVSHIPLFSGEAHIQKMHLSGGGLKILP